MRKDNFHLLIQTLLIALTINSCITSDKKPNEISIAGSDTMYYLTIRLASEYMKLNPGIVLHVKGGGSSAGFEALQNGNADICISSRNIRSDEVKTLADNYSAIGMSYLIAKDALSIYNNWYNPVESLSLDDVKKIFTCKSVKWSEFGGREDIISTVIRTPQSGTYEYFKSHILLDEEFCDNALSSNSTQSVLNAIIKDRNAIGFGGIGYQEGVRLMKINGIEPTEANVKNDTYPIVRYLYFYTVKSPGGEVKKFIDWTMSPSAQRIIDNFGYISIWN
ncbi:MAG: phosphate ABC transporter substrate-binding protein [Candidatus Kapabacteria bacterium]|nr:phosphate ABC transporter substrate-binding protein [Ignavibacteriota bacterium]MCW5883428.1 phosphate ABC transporter substrate-binding protein [Candidatus Kapabacteria bacterium]